jgi:adenylylsulfate kinase
LLARHGIVTAAAVVSPYREARDGVRKMVPNFIEIYVKAPLAVCIQRDVKGLYAKALAGEISHFTGVSDPYEEPIKAEIVLETSTHSAIECTELILRWLENAQLIRRTR